MKAIFVVATQSDTVITDTAFGGLFAAWMAFVVLVSLLALAALGLCIWNIVDVARRPDYQFEQSGQSKVLWILLPVLGIAVCQLIGVVAPIIYFTSVRKKLDAVPPMPVGPYPGGYQAGYPYAPYPPAGYAQGPYPAGPPQGTYPPAPYPPAGYPGGDVPGPPVDGPPDAPRAGEGRAQPPF